MRPLADYLREQGEVLRALGVELDDEHWRQCGDTLLDVAAQLRELAR